MAVRRNIFLIALLCSLGLHLASLGVYLGVGRWRAKFTHDASLVALKPQPAEQEMIVYPDMGEATGSGIGSNSSPGEKPLQAPEADEDQAMLDRRPTGNPRGAPMVKTSDAPPGEGRGGTPQAQEVAQALRQAVQELTRKLEEKAAEIKKEIPTPPVEATAPPLPKVEKADIPIVPKKTEVVKISPPPVAPPPPVVAPKPEPAKPVQVAKSADNGDAKTPGALQPIGQPLPQSDSDSDPFLRISGSARVINGHVVPRLGRDVHTKRPQLDVSGQLDLIALNNPIVVVEVHIAATGKVLDVKVAHSSGSNQIDEPTRLAVYDWWFEPARNKQGRAVPDVIFFSIQYID